MIVYSGFRNFHRSLCARFNYPHDEIHFRRDLVSLEEAIAKRINTPTVSAMPAEIPRDLLAQIVTQAFDDCCEDTKPIEDIYRIVARQYAAVPTVSATVPITGHKLDTSAGGRGYVADYFAKRMNRHDFGRYITERLAADFACALAAHLDSLQGAPTVSATNQHPDDDAVDRFAEALKEKLAQARKKGRSGWHECDPRDLSTMLREHVEKGDPRDVANFCMFLWSLGQPISPILGLADHIESLRRISERASNAAPTPPTSAADAAELRARVLSEISTFAGMAPEPGEDWDAWYCAAFDMLGSNVRNIFSDALIDASIAASKKESGDE
ncbi:hypothetical protein [Schauerella aestuarii]|uniref:hypothetical protein n=1 Tax=Schauerella aestuarii TaxID=2511204 RepID=UPI0019269FB1|nr:hypothetical protein [Achromobacter aestuarii]